MLPVSPDASSTTKRFHTPLGLVALNVARVVALDGAGAGAGNVSGPLESTRLVGWNVPVPSAPVAGSWLLAASSNVSVPFTGNPVSPFTSDISTRFSPPGPTSSMSMSVAIACTTLVKVTFTSVTVPESPDTVMADGYGDAGPTEPDPGIAIAVVLLKETTSASDVSDVTLTSATASRLAAITRTRRRCPSAGRIMTVLLESALRNRTPFALVST